MALHLVSKWAGHSDLETTQQHLHVNEDYEWIEMQKMLSNEVANEKVVALDEYRKVGQIAPLGINIAVLQIFFHFTEQY